MNPMNMSTPKAKNQKRRTSGRKRKTRVNLNDSVHELNLGSPPSRNGITISANKPDKSDKQLEKVLQKVNDMQVSYDEIIKLLKPVCGVKIKK